MDKVADALHLALTTASGAELDELMDAMQEFREKAPRSLDRLLRSPGFAKLWTAMGEAVVE